MANVQLFLSTVSAEFRSVRDALRAALDRPNVSVKVQEDFVATGTETLDKLDDYIRRCDAVIHLVGDMTGAPALPPSVALIARRYADLGERLPPLAPFLLPGAEALSYTQWEAWLALCHRKTLLVAVPADGAPRDAGHLPTDAGRAAQQAHLARLAEVERHPEIRFDDAKSLAIEVLRSRLHDILAAAGGVTRPANLPYPSLGSLFKGRDAELAELARSLGAAPCDAASPTAIRVLHGMGGIGKTRLAVEHAWRHAGGYTALLYAGAGDPEALQRNLAALCGRSLLDLPEQAQADQALQRDAVLAWLQSHPGWLLVLDNVDSPEAAAACEALLPRLAGGHVLLTSRLTQWGGGVRTLPVGLLAPDAAADFLLDRTAAGRRPQPDDATAARALADELGHLALALEQAGAYIAQRRQTFAQYRADWERQRGRVLAWHDARLMSYPASVAITWQTSFDRLGEPARALLRRLAWLAPEPVPESLIDVSVPGVEEADADPWAALAELAGYSLAARAAEAPVFAVHRLVQEVARRGQGAGDAAPPALLGALRWINRAFTGDPQDVRNWPLLDPLLPHARAVATHADSFGIADPTTRLMSEIGTLLYVKALNTEAEPVMRRALSIDETIFGKSHPAVARHLNNLAQLLGATNRLAEAEPLMRRVLAIDEAIFGNAHPDVARDINNLAQLLRATNRLSEAEPLMRRALAVAEASFGETHPKVAICLNNLAQVLKVTHRLSEAESSMCRALAIDRASFGEAHPNVARNLNNLATLFQITNRLAQAESLLRQALAIDEASFGKGHPEVATDLNNLAQLLQAIDRLSEAEPLMRRALEILLSLDYEHPNKQTAVENYVVLLRAAGQSDASIEAELAALFSAARQEP